MRKLLISLWLVALAAAATVGQPIGVDVRQPVPDAKAPEAKAGKADAKLPRGLNKTPPQLLTKIAIERPFIPRPDIKLPASVAYVPKKISYWLNNQYGCCVTTEEAFNQA